LQSEALNEEIGKERSANNSVTAGGAAETDFSSRHLTAPSVVTDLPVGAAVAPESRGWASTREGRGHEQA
jgi:hypothetical protein